MSLIPEKQTEKRDQKIYLYNKKNEKKKKLSTTADFALKDIPRYENNFIIRFQF